MELIFQEGFAFRTKLFLDFVLSIPYYFYLVALVFFISMIRRKGSKIV